MPNPNFVCYTCKSFPVKYFPKGVFRRIPPASRISTISGSIYAPLYRAEYSQGVVMVMSKNTGGIYSAQMVAPTT